MYTVDYITSKNNNIICTFKHIASIWDFWNLKPIVPNLFNSGIQPSNFPKVIPNRKYEVFSIKC